MSAGDGSTRFSRASPSAASQGRETCSVAGPATLSIDSQRGGTIGRRGPRGRPAGGRRVPERHVDAGARRVRARVRDHDDRGVSPAATRRVHGVADADRARAGGGGRLRDRSSGGHRLVERHVSHSTRPAPALHARGARPDGLLALAARLHAQLLDDGAARPGVLRRLLRVRAAVPWPLSGPAPAARLRPRTGRTARPTRGRDRRRARRRRLPVPLVGAVRLSRRGVGDDPRLRRGGRLRPRGRGPRARLQGCAELHRH